MRYLTQNLLFLSLLLMTACSSGLPTGKTKAEVLFKEAELLVKDERFLMATERLNTLKSQYPYSFYATHAELLLADILFAQGSYVEAAAAYQIFKDFHPKHEKIEYVLYRIAESFYSQLPDTFDRDLSPAYQAMKYFREYSEKYPTGERSASAREKIEKCKLLLAKKDRYIADFYYKVKSYNAAAYRYKDILQVHEDDNQLKEHARRRIVLSYFKGSDYVNCLKYYKNFSQDFEGKNYSKNLSRINTQCRQEYERTLVNEVSGE